MLLGRYSLSLSYLSALLPTGVCAPLSELLTLRADAWLWDIHMGAEDGEEAQCMVTAQGET